MRAFAYLALIAAASALSLQHDATRPPADFQPAAPTAPALDVPPTAQVADFMKAKMGADAEGNISVDQLINICKAQWGSEASDAEVAQLKGLADGDSNGKVTPAELHGFLGKLLKMDPPAFAKLMKFGAPAPPTKA